MFKTILILCAIVMFVGCYGMDPDFRYDYKYYKEANGWLKLHHVPMRWGDARLQCYYEGSVLVSPENKEIIAGLVKLQQEKRLCPDVMWSGVSASYAKGIYTSIEGLPLERMPIYWSLNEPASSDGCLVIYTNGTMGAKNCRDEYPFICYKMYETLVINQCGTVDNEYQLLENGTKCYKYHSKWEDWATAYRICHAEGAFLVISNDYGNHFIERQNTNIVSVGFKPIEGKWWDIHGNLMVPYRSGGSFMSCGGRKWDGSFTTIQCSENHAFICEKLIDSLLSNNAFYFS